MSWAHGIIRLPDGTEMEVGYGVDTKCEHGRCRQRIDRGLAYRCGGENFDVGCGHYFCGRHLSISPQLCATCYAARTCWRCGEELGDDFPGYPCEPICDICYDQVVTEQDGAIVGGNE